MMSKDFTKKLTFRLVVSHRILLKVLRSKAHKTPSEVATTVAALSQKLSQLFLVKNSTDRQRGGGRRGEHEHTKMYMQEWLGEGMGER